MRYTFKEASTQCPKMLKWATALTKFGPCFAAFNDKILVFMTFFDSNLEVPIEALRRLYPHSGFRRNKAFSKTISQIIEDTNITEISFKGTDFEIKVWQAVLEIKKGKTASYEDVAKAVGRPKAARAVGRALGKNPLAYVVPCHRVIRKNGDIHMYSSGGPERKKMILEYEGAI